MVPDLDKVGARCRHIELYVYTPVYALTMRTAKAEYVN